MIIQMLFSRFPTFNLRYFLIFQVHIIVNDYLKFQMHRMMKRFVTSIIYVSTLRPFILLLPSTCWLSESPCFCFSLLDFLVLGCTSSFLHVFLACLPSWLLCNDRSNPSPILLFYFSLVFCFAFSLRTSQGFWNSWQWALVCD